MKRNKMDDLIKWKNKERRKPLLIYGARQVGKTYFDDMIYVNFEKK